MTRQHEVFTYRLHVLHPKYHISYVTVNVHVKALCCAYKQSSLYFYSSLPFGNVESDSYFAVFLMAYTLPMLYEKYEDQVDVVGEKALIEIKKQYKVIDAKFISKIPMLSEKKQH